MVLQLLGGLDEAEEGLQERPERFRNLNRPSRLVSVGADDIDRDRVVLVDADGEIHEHLQFDVREAKVMKFRVDGETDEDVFHGEIDLLVVDGSTDDLQKHQDDGGLLIEHAKVEEGQDVIHVDDEPPPVDGVPHIRGGDVVMRWGSDEDR